MVGPGAKGSGGVRLGQPQSQEQEGIRDQEGGAVQTHEAEVRPLREAKGSHPDSDSAPITGRPVQTLFSKRCLPHPHNPVNTHTHTHTHF